MALFSEYVYRGGDCVYLFRPPDTQDGSQTECQHISTIVGQALSFTGIQVFVAAVIFLGMPLYAAVVMKGGAVFIEQIFQIDFNVSLLIFTLVIAAYVIAGGMKG